MSRIKLPYNMQLKSDTIFSSGHSIPGGDDISLRMTADNKPYMAGATIKGLLREQLENWLIWNGSTETVVQETLAVLFGKADRGGAVSERRLSFLDLHINASVPEADWYSSRTFTALKDGIVKDGTLRSAVCLNRGLTFSGAVYCDEQDRELVENGLKCIKWVGLLRNRGFGSIAISVQAAEAVEAFEAVNKITAASCITYRVRLRTPLTVASVAGEDRYRQKPGAQRSDANNYTETLKCIPGSTVRGMVISWLAQNEPAWFEENKEALLGDATRFLRARPVIDGIAALPTPKGFYADKQETEFYNVLKTKKVKPGHKRASIGAYCTITNNKIEGHTPKTQSIMRIQRGKEKQVFTATALLPNTEWEGCIQLDQPELAEHISRAFRETVWLGADRYAGYGCCEVLSLYADACGGYSTAYAAQDSVPEILYMMAVSPFTMTKNGEIVGIDADQLKVLLGVDTLEIKMCATSIIQVNGFNRTWECASPTVIMYDKGSVFQLKCSPAPKVDKLLALERIGIGIRRSEGFGQVTFIKDFEKLEKQRIEERKVCQRTDTQKIRQARCTWLMEHELPKGMSKSQIGELQARCEQALIQNGDLTKVWEYLEHNIENRGAQHGQKFKRMKAVLTDILEEKPLAETLGLPADIGCKDTVKERLKLVCDWMDVSRKEAD